MPPSFPNAIKLLLTFPPTFLFSPKTGEERVDYARSWAHELTSPTSEEAKATAALVLGFLANDHPGFLLPSSSSSSSSSPSSSLLNSLMAPSTSLSPSSMSLRISTPPSPLDLEPHIVLNELSKLVFF